MITRLRILLIIISLCASVLLLMIPFDAHEARGISEHLAVSSARVVLARPERNRVVEPQVEPMAEPEHDPSVETMPSLIEDQEGLEDTVKVEDLPTKSKDPVTGEEGPAPMEMELMFHDIAEVTTAPRFDLALLASRLTYPPVARRQGKEGTVILRLYILGNGTIVRMDVVDDPGFGFTEAAIGAFEGLDARPATKNGRPIAVSMLFPVRFSLN